MPILAAGDLIVESWLNFRRNLRAYSEIAVWFTVLGLLRWAIATVASTLSDDAIFRYALSQLLSLPIYFMYALLAVATIDLVGNHVSQRSMDVRVALMSALHKVFAYIWVSILAGVGIVIGYIFFIVPGVLLTVRWKFAQNFVVLDGMRGRAAISASSKIVSGRWWPVALRLAAPAIFFYAGVAFVTSLSYLLFGSILGDPGLFFGQYSATQILPKTHGLITQLIPQAISALALPLYIGAELMLWNDLKKSA